MSAFRIFLFIPHQKLLTWYQPVDLSNRPPLPPCLISLLDLENGSRSECRLVWKSNVTKRRMHGRWTPLATEHVLQKIVDRSAMCVSPRLKYWIEYQR